MNFSTSRIEFFFFSFLSTFEILMTIYQKSIKVCLKNLLNNYILPHVTTYFKVHISSFII